MGASGEGRISHIKVSQKLDMMGIGAAHTKDPNGIAWKQNKDFERLLERLNNSDGTEPVSDIKSSELKSSFNKATTDDALSPEPTLSKEERKRKRKEEREEKKAKKMRKGEKDEETPTTTPASLDVIAAAEAVTVSEPAQRIVPRHRAYVFLIIHLAVKH